MRHVSVYVVNRYTQVFNLDQRRFMCAMRASQYWAKCEPNHGCKWSQLLYLDLSEWCGMRLSVCSFDVLRRLMFVQAITGPH